MGADYPGVSGRSFTASKLAIVGMIMLDLLGLGGGYGYGMGRQLGSTMDYVPT